MKNPENPPGIMRNRPEMQKNIRTWTPTWICKIKPENQDSQNTQPETMKNK